MADAALRCPFCAGFLVFSFLDEAGEQYVYRCTRCPDVDERLFILNPMREVEAIKKNQEWTVGPPHNRKGYGQNEPSQHTRNT